MPVAIPVERAIVISDLHLRRPSGERTRMFLEFLARRVAPAPPDVLVVAGDLFDFCTPVGGRMPPTTRAVLEALEALPRVVWLEGNHDFRLASGLRGSRIEIQTERQLLDWSDRTVLLQHGDLITPGGRRTRRLLSSSMVAVAARLLGLRGTWLAGSLVGLARSGMHGYDGRSAAWLDVARAFAGAQAQQGVDLCALGHGHWLGRWDRLVCLGDWPRYRSYLELSLAGEVRLLRYESAAPEDPLFDPEPMPR